MTSDDMVMVPRALLFDLRCYGDINTVEGVLYGRSHRDRLREADEILAGAAPVPPSPPRDDDDVRDRVADCRVENADSGHWRSCSGCYETEDGHPTGPYPFSESFGCYLGSGCSECGGIGAIWDTTDYADMAAHMVKSDPPRDEVDDTDDLLNVLCEDFGCEPGSNRIHWLREQLSNLTSVHVALKEARSMLRACRIDDPDGEGADIKESWDRGLARIDAALSKLEGRS